MCKFKCRFLAAFLTFGIGVLVIGIWRNLPVSENSTEPNYSQPAAYSDAQPPDLERHDPFLPERNSFLDCDEQNKINYQGVSFSCSSQFSSRIELLEFSKSPLQSEDDKPDYVHPSYISFEFRNKEENLERESNYDKQISIYPTEEYGRMYSIDESYSQWFDEDIKSFKKLLSAKKAHKNTNTRFLEATDGSFEFKSHLKYLSFKNGKGVGFVTEIAMEPSIINNKELIWVFEGITNDGKYYILASFPVRASFLPNTSTDEFEGYSSDNYEKLSKNNKKYVSLIKRRLDTFPANQFQPNLENIEELISSLKIK